MKVGTYNIRYDTPLDENWSWIHRKQNVIEQIKHMDTDIFGVVEALSHQKKDLESGLPSYQTIGVARGDGIDDGEYNLIFFKKDRFKLIDSGHQWISETPNEPSIYPDAGSPRVIVWGIFEEKNTKKQFAMMVTHLDDASQKARNLGSFYLKQLLTTSKFKTLPSFLVGDFNFFREDQAYKEILDFMKDSTLDNEGLSIVPHTYQEQSEFIPHNPKKFTQLDYIFVNSHLETLGVTIGKDISKTGKYPSDHFPIWGEYEFI